MRTRPTFTALLTVLAVGCTGSITGDDGGAPPRDVPASDAPGSDAPDAATSAITPRLYDVATAQIDPRFATLPASISTVELVPETTLLAEVGPTIESVRFTVDGAATIDDEAPFRYRDDADGPHDWSLDVGAHEIEIEGFTSSDASGTAVATFSGTLEITTRGTDPTPGDGGHIPVQIWLTSEGDYVTRDEDGNFVNGAGESVLDFSEVRREVRGDDQGFFVSDGGPTLDFAFGVLMPEGYDPTVRYPVVVVLHHGAEFYRGTDLDSRLFTQPPLNGPRSIIGSDVRHTHPAIVYVPQLPFHGEMAGVRHEWAAFTAIDGDGHCHSAPDVSVGSRPMLDVLADLVSGDVDVVPTSIEPRRIYVTGHSMGGLGTWDLIARQPDLWAAAAPMAGYPDFDRAAALVDTPIWAFHHRIDCYNVFSGTDTMHQLIVEENGGEVMRFTALEFDTGGACDQAHFRTPDEAFSDETLLPWMFSQVNARSE